MDDYCRDLRQHVGEVLAEWEQLVRKQPWYSLPPEHRIDNLPDVVVGLVEASLCEPRNLERHRQQVEAAVGHGFHRRTQGIPESLILTEFHLLRQAIWNYLVRKFGPAEGVVTAIMRIDCAITLATNASMWGYHRPEITALGKWDAGIERLSSSSPLLY
jgi:hypothetical protein